MANDKTTANVSAEPADFDTEGLKATVIDLFASVHTGRTDQIAIDVSASEGGGVRATVRHVRDDGRQGAKRDSFGSDEAAALTSLRGCVRHDAEIRRERISRALARDEAVGRRAPFRAVPKALMACPVHKCVRGPNHEGDCVHEWDSIKPKVSESSADGRDNEQRLRTAKGQHHDRPESIQEKEAHPL